MKELPDNRPICVPCSRKEGKIRRLKCEKTGVVVPYGKNGMRWGDLYQCPKCGTTIVFQYSPPVSPPSSLIEMLQDKDRNILFGVTDT